MKDYRIIMRSLREDSDLTQKQVADVLQTTQQVYSCYENGKNEMPIRHLIELAKLYQVSTDYLLGLKEKKNYE